MIKNPPDEKYVYHGSEELFGAVIPKRNRRIKVHTSENGNGKEHEIHEVIFDEISFHATPFRWIGLAYTLDRKSFEFNDAVGGVSLGKAEQYYNMGVSLYENEERISIYGIGSLEESLEKLYGDGGYLYIFEKEKFFHTKGLGDLEVIIKENTVPYSVERIDDPVTELRKLGIGFDFIDLSLPENDKYRNR